MTYEEAVNAAILDPLGMSSTSFDAPVDLSRLAYGYSQQGDIVPPYTLNFSNPAGGAYSTVRDLASLMSFFFESLPDNLPVQPTPAPTPSAPRTKESKAYSFPPPLPPAHMLRSWINTNYFPSYTSPQPGEIDFAGYGNPWEIWRANFIGQTFAPQNMSIFDMVIKLGDVLAYDSVFAMLPKLKLGLIMLRTQAPAASQGIAGLGLQLLSGILAPAFQKDLLALNEGLYKPLQPASNFVGTYCLEQYAPVNFTIAANQDGSLCMYWPALFDVGCAQLIPSGSSSDGTTFGMLPPPGRTCEQDTGGAYTISFMQKSANEPAYALDAQGFYIYPTIFVKAT